MTGQEPDSTEISKEIDDLLAKITVEETSNDTEDSETNTSESQSNNSERFVSKSTAEQILQVLRDDARLSYDEIADRVDVSKPTVRKYINQLEAKEVIVGYSVDIDPAKLRQTTISIVKIDIADTYFETATTAIANLDSVYSLYTLRDRVAVIGEIRADGFNEFSDIISNEIRTIEGVEAAHTTILEGRRK
jgi:Lrp/AsnC family transcriptional regulator for asnA, asnC and gidA